MKQEGTDKVKILHILIGGDTFTGIASFLHQFYLHMDREQVHFDFLFCRKNCMQMVMDNPIYADSHFFELDSKRRKTNSTNYLNVYRQIKQFLRDHEYDAVVINTSLVVVVTASVLAAKINPKLLVLAHAHNAGLVVKKKCIRSKLKNLVRIFDNACRWLIRKNCDHFFACSEEAAIATFGTKIMHNPNLKIVNNAIDIEKFLFNAELRDKIRKSFNTNETTSIYGNVGRLADTKNQSFLIETFYHLHQKQPDSELWLIGEGPERDALEKKVSSLGLQNAVRFMGQCDHVNELYQAMDCFVFTTKSEGLGIVAIEAQAAGLPTIISDGVPSAAKITELCEQISLKESPDVWAEKVLEFCQKHTVRNRMNQAISDAGYDIETEAKKLTQFYMSVKKQVER